MTWLIASLAVLAGLFYGMWQRALAKRATTERDRARESLKSLGARWEDDTRRYNAVVTALHAEITRLEEASLANATPGELRARLAALLRSSPKD